MNSYTTDLSIKHWQSISQLTPNKWLNYFSRELEEIAYIQQK